VNQSAGDSALRRVGGADAADNAVMHSFACVVHFHDFRHEAEHLASSGDQMLELDFHVRGVVGEAKADFATWEIVPTTSRPAGKTGRESHSGD